jgi:hypothetical protein
VSIAKNHVIDTWTTIRTFARYEPMFDDLITFHSPPPNRIEKCHGETEHHLSEGAVMLAFAMHLFRTTPQVVHVAIHPDGEHGKRFDFQSWLTKRGFAMTVPKGTTTYGGTYASSEGKTLTIYPKSGLGDVVAQAGELKIVAECKGGVINTSHPGQLSRLRKGLCEAVGLLLAERRSVEVRQYAVVPHTATTETLARRMASRAREAGIEIALVDLRGNVIDVR